MESKTKRKKGIRAAQKEARPKEIVDAALGVFARDGFAGARLEDVAERVGISKGTIYLYFENKEDVFKACVRQTIGVQLQQTMAMAASFEGPISDLLREIFRRMSGHLSQPDYRTILLLLISEGRRFPELASFYYEEMLAPGIEGLRSIIQRGVDSGEFRDTGLADYPMLIMSPIIASVIWNHLFSDHKPFGLKDAMQAHLDTMLEGLKA